MSNKDILFTIRIDKETNELISYLKSLNIKYTDIVREHINIALNNKCIEYKKYTNKENLPF